MVVSGRHLKEGASIIVNGRKVEGTVKLGGKERVEIELASLPSEGMNFIQLQNKDGLFSNDFIFHVSDKKIDPPQLREKLEVAIYKGNLSELKRLVESGAGVNALSEGGGSPLEFSRLSWSARAPGFFSKTEPS